MTTNPMFDVRTCTSHEREIFTVIQKAVIEPEPKTLRFEYTKKLKDGTDGEVSQRHVEPYEVIGGDKPQLAAWDIDKQALRRFILAGISEIQTGDDSFNARYPIKIVL